MILDVEYICPGCGRRSLHGGVRIAWQEPYCVRCRLLLLTQLELALLSGSSYRAVPYTPPRKWAA